MSSSPQERKRWSRGQQAAAGIGFALLSMWLGAYTLARVFDSWAAFPALMSSFASVAAGLWTAVHAAIERLDEEWWP